MYLFTQFWKLEDNRRKEILECLIENSKNRYIKKIVIFHEPGSELNVKHNKIKNVEINNRLNYYEMIRESYKYNNSSSILSIVAHADIHFDSTISQLNSEMLENTVLTLSSYHNNKISDFCVDSFIFNPSNVSKFIRTNYPIGESHNDLRFINSIVAAGFEVKNPCLDIKSIHVDETTKLKCEMNEVFDYPEPQKITSKLVSTRNNIEDINIKIETMKKLESEKITLVDKINNIRINMLRTDNIASKERLKSKRDILKKEVDHINSRIQSTPNIKKSVKPVLKKRLPVNGKVVVVIHLYYQDMWEEFSTYLKNITLDFDLYVTLSKGSATIGQTEWMGSKIKSEFDNANVSILDNKGLDIGPFLLSMNKIFESGKDYDYLVKLQSKKSLLTAGEADGRQWRNQLIQPLLGSQDIFEDNINKLSNIAIGMVGSKDWVTNHVLTNHSTIKYFNDKLGIKKNIQFIGGTIFMVRFDVLKKYLNKDNTKEIYLELEEGYFTDHKNPTKTHALERIFGYMVGDCGKKIIGV